MAQTEYILIGDQKPHRLDLTPQFKWYKISYAVFIVNNL